MKTISTSKFKSLLIILIVFLSMSVYSQTRHIVSVTSNKFTPKDLTISVGDIVEWQNNTTVGHNVNGTKTTYPSNPESFGNSVSSNWTYEWTFTIPGKYDYRCDPHILSGMVGTITVNTVTSSNSNLTDNVTKIYPNPAQEKVFIEPKSFLSKEFQVKIHDISGKNIFSETFVPKERIEINTDQMTKGIYFIELSNKEKREMHKLIKD